MSSLTAFFSLVVCMHVVGAAAAADGARIEAEIRYRPSAASPSDIPSSVVEANLVRFNCNFTDGRKQLARRYVSKGAVWNKLKCPNRRCKKVFTFKKSLDEEAWQEVWDKEVQKHWQEKCSPDREQRALGEDGKNKRSAEKQQRKRAAATAAAASAVPRSKKRRKVSAIGRALVRARAERSLACAHKLAFLPVCIHSDGCSRIQRRLDRVILAWSAPVSLARLLCCFRLLRGFVWRASAPSIVGIVAP